MHLPNDFHLLGVRINCSVCFHLNRTEITSQPGAMNEASHVLLRFTTSATKGLNVTNSTLGSSLEKELSVAPAGPIIRNKSRKSTVYARRLSIHNKTLPPVTAHLSVQ